jgi:hypothetical protein
MWINESFLESFLLCFFGDIEIEFDDGCSIGLQDIFKCIDLLISSFDNFFIDISFDGGDEDIFIVRAIEDSETSFGRYLPMDTSQEVMSKFFFAWSTE